MPHRGRRAREAAQQKSIPETRMEASRLKAMSSPPEKASPQRLQQPSSAPGMAFPTMASAMTARR